MRKDEEIRPLRIALVGNPNCGKSSLFNVLTGSRQKVANYAGVTVELKAGDILTPRGRPVKILDLPGTYSLRARSPDEEITRDAVLGKRSPAETPEMILCVADATNLRLALRLALELRRVGRPMALVLNMYDIARHRGVEIDLERLSSELKIPVVSSVAVRRGGIKDLLTLIDDQIDTMAKQAPSPPLPSWSAPNRDELCALQYEADRIIAATVVPPKESHSITARLDAVLLHPVWGLLILLGVLFLMFQAVFTWAQPFTELLEAGIHFLGAQTDVLLPEGLFHSFVREGLIEGVGSVVAFLPQILVLFLFILILEDFGYMARAAFLMDKIMGSAGLHGRAFIPLLSSFACAVPAIMATRVIDNRRDRLTTILIAPLMTCSARIPVFTLIISAFIPSRKVLGGLELQGLVMFSLYALGIAGAFLYSFVLRRIVWRNAFSEPFLMELPDYKKPNLRTVFFALLQRAKIFLVRAGTTIAAATLVIWFLVSFPASPKDASEPPILYSYAAQIGKALEPVFAPIGFNWQMNVALIPGMAAREIAVATLGTVYSVEKGGADVNLSQTLAHEWSLATALAFLAWFVFAPQCLSTLVMIRKETGSSKWLLFSLGTTLALAYTAAFIVYRTTLLLSA